MSDKCGYCGKPYVKYPIKGQPEKTLGENYREKTIIWKNLFKMEFSSIVLFISVLLITFAYQHDIAQCNEIIKDPYHYCVKAGCNPNPIMEAGNVTLFFNKEDYLNAINNT